MRVSGVHRSATVVALVTLAAVASRYVLALCPDCARPIGAMPAEHVEVRIIAGYSEARGRGPVVKCRQCKHLCEVIGHG